MGRPEVEEISEICASCTVSERIEKGREVVFGFTRS